MSSYCESYCAPTQITDNCPPFCFLTCPSPCAIPAPPDGTTPTVHHKSHKLEPLIISLAILGFCCFSYCIFALYKLYKNGTRPIREQGGGDHDEEHGTILGHSIWPTTTIGLHPSTINSITAIKYKTGEGLVDGTDCSVCLSEFQDDETLRLLPKCSHAFHLPCIDTWLRSHTNCPMCRAPIVANPNVALSLIPEQSFRRSSGSSVLENSQVANSYGSLSPVLEQSLQRNSESSVLDNCQVAVPEGSGVRGRESEEIGEHQLMSRSVSIDSLAALRLSSDIENARLGESSERNAVLGSKRMDQNQGSKRFMGSCSFRRSLQKEPVLMKRSFSCSGKVLSLKQNQDTKSVLPQ